jgi:putative transcriptional regulator
MSEGYHYIGCGLGNVWLKNGCTMREDAYGTSVEIEDLEGLHRTIGRELVNKVAPLTGAELRFLRIEMDLSQRRLGELLGREGQTVALWEKGEQLQEGTDYLVRHIYRQFVGEQSSYVEEVDRLRALDQREYEDGFAFEDGTDGWRTSAVRVG